MMALTFLEGLTAFISPCILPMLPVYLMFLSGEEQERSQKKLVFNTLCFILGFTLLFVLLGAGASSIGRLLQSHQLLLQRISGILLIVFGSYYAGFFKIPFLQREWRFGTSVHKLTPLRSLVFGAAFSFGWTPCLGPMLGAALTLAGNTRYLWEGMLLLLLFSLGLGVPFLITALLYNRLTGAFNWLKRHHLAIQRIAGVILIVFGILLTFNIFGYYAGLFG
jgi:cytochrome c-type biogenesis protein